MPKVTVEWNRAPTRTQNAFHAFRIKNEDQASFACLLGAGQSIWLVFSLGRTYFFTFRSFNTRTLTRILANSNLLTLLSPFLTILLPIIRTICRFLRLFGMFGNVLDLDRCCGVQLKFLVLRWEENNLRQVYFARFYRVWMRRVAN